MEFVLIGVAALLTSGLTLFSGFGVGIILMPVFALLFPLPLAIAATAVVHFANNLFKFGLIDGFCSVSRSFLWHRWSQDDGRSRR